MSGVGAADLSKHMRATRAADPRVPKLEAFQRAVRENRDSSLEMRDSEIAPATALLTSGPRHSAKLVLTSGNTTVTFEAINGELTKQDNKHVLVLRRTGQQGGDSRVSLRASDVQYRLSIDGQADIDVGALKIDDVGAPAPKAGEMRAITFRNKQPLASAAQKIAACQNGLPIAYLRTRGKLFTNGRDSTVYAGIESVHIELLEEACPALVSMRPNARDTYEDFPLTNGVRFNASQIDAMIVIVKEVTFHSAVRAPQMIVSARGKRVFPAPSNEQIDDNTPYLHPIGQVTQTVFAAGYMLFLSKALQTSAENVRDRIKNDETLLEELLTSSGALALLAGLKQVFPERMPTVLQLLLHTSGLPYALSLDTDDLEAALDAKPDERLESEDVEAIFATQLVEQCVGKLLFEPGQSREESALGFAILTFTLPDYDYMSVIAPLMKQLRITAAHYSDRCPPKSPAEKARDSTKYEPGYTQSQGIFGAYAGLHMSTTALSAFASQRGWVPRDALDAAEMPWDETDETLDWLSNLYTLRVAIGQREDAVFGVGNLLITTEFNEATSGVPIIFDSSIMCCGKKATLVYIMPTAGIATVLTFENPTPLTASNFREISSNVASSLAKMLLTSEQIEASKRPLYIPRGDFQAEFHRRSAELIENSALENGVDSLSPSLQALVRETREKPLRAVLEGRRPDAVLLRLEVGKTQPDGRERLMVVLHTQDNHDATRQIVVRVPGTDGAPTTLRTINPAMQTLADDLELIDYALKSNIGEADTLVRFRDRLFVPESWASGIIGLIAPNDQDGIELARMQEARDKERMMTRRERRERRQARRAAKRREREAQNRASRTADDEQSSDSEADVPSRRDREQRSPRSDGEASSGSDTDGTSEMSTVNIKRALFKGLLKRHKHALRDGEKVKNFGKFAVFPQDSRAFASVMGFPAGMPLSTDAEFEAILNQSGKPEYYTNESKARTSAAAIEQQ